MNMLYVTNKSVDSTIDCQVMSDVTFNSFRVQPKIATEVADGIFIDTSCVISSILLTTISKAIPVIPVIHGELDKFALQKLAMIFPEYGAKFRLAAATGKYDEAKSIISKLRASGNWDKLYQRYGVMA